MILKYIFERLNRYAYKLFGDFNWYKTIRGFYIRLKFSVKYRNKSFIFLNGAQLSEEKQRFLEDNKIWKKALAHLLIYKLKNDARQTVVVNLKDSELFKLSDILLRELFGGAAFKVNYSFFSGELLRCVYPAENRQYKYCENLLNFYLNNYTAQKDKCSVVQSFLDMYKYAIGHIQGNSILDTGSGSALFPILVKLKMPEIEVTASDYDYGYFDEFAAQYCKDNGTNIQFRKLDILSPSIDERYDTVTSIHTLEHFGKKDTAAVINNLLKIANKRLIAIFPFEDLATLKSHRQRLNEKKLKKIIQKLGLPYKIEKISLWNYALIIDIDK